MKKHYEKIMFIATCLFSCNLVLSDTFKLHQTSCNGHGFLIVKSYSLKYNKTKECEILILRNDLKF
jgi:positive regulator of sigma E activity